MAEEHDPKKADIDPAGEIEAMKTVLAALTPLSEIARESVLDYVLKRLRVKPRRSSDEPARDNTPDAAGDERALPPQLRQVPGGTHLKDFVTAKRPRTDSEMLSVVAYWLRELAGEGDRRDYVTRKDVEQYFKIGEYPLPKRPEFTLPNAKGAGYFEQLGDGKYRLNPVGHNLVAHTLPRPASSRSSSPVKKARKRPRVPSKRKRG
jgi:hypothetical protein